jgi:hypothetical protein
MSCKKINKPINIIFSSISSTSSIVSDNYFSATIEVSLRINRDEITKYIDKKLTEKDLFNIIKNRI